MLVKDTIIVPLSDMHSGSMQALFPNRFWQSDSLPRNHTPTSAQRKMFNHFERCAEYIKHKRKNKRVIVVHNGDAIEGVHHSTLEVVTYIIDEQADIHIELMEHFLSRIGFDGCKGDKLFYTIGTDAHVNNKENQIARKLPVQRNDNGGWTHQDLLLNVNGRRVLFLHHGPKRGDGANQGNPLRLWMGRLYWQNLLHGIPQSDLVFTGHYHTPVYNTYVQDYHVMHGVICPSWQMKTRYAHEKVPVDLNEIGMISVEIKADGEIRPPVPMLLETSVMKARNL